MDRRVIVVDIGCQPQGREESITKLCEAFKPSILFGFDPHPALQPGVELHDHSVPRRRRERWGQTIIVRSRLAAWTLDGFLPFRETGITSGVEPGNFSVPIVPCFDLVAWLRTLPMPETPVVVKMDCEGAEYPLCVAIVESALDLLIDEMLIEWHPEQTAHGMFMAKRPKLRCPVDDWEANW